jgi:hypothetical protein
LNIRPHLRDRCADQASQQLPKWKIVKGSQMNDVEIHEIRLVEAWTAIEQGTVVERKT